MTKVKKVGVLGCGTMGAGIVQVAAQAGYQVLFLEVTEAGVTAGVERIQRFLAEGVRRGKQTEAGMAEILGRIRGTTRYEELAPCHMVIEAVFEELSVKQNAMRALSAVLPPEALVASNTSCLSVTEIASAYAHPERVVGLHFFNPAPLMKLVEVVRALETSDAAFDETYEFTRSLGKEPVRTKDSPGFLVNSLLIPYVNQAIQAYDDGVATREDLDAAVELGLGYPMGPLKLADLMGMDVHVHAAKAIYDATGDRHFLPPPLLQRMVKAGRLGRKTGQGFYDYRKG